MTTAEERGQFVPAADTRAGRPYGDREAIYWHRQLPPADAEVMAEHVIEATSGRVRGSLSRRDELWDRCYADLMDSARRRLKQEIERLGGDYAHVLAESIEGRHDDATTEVWLHGRFTYVLYRQRPM
jgi:hypothetical protein